jgi:hypothetical protein
MKYDAMIKNQHGDAGLILGCWVSIGLLWKCCFWREVHHKEKMLSTDAGLLQPLWYSSSLPTSLAEKFAILPQDKGPTAGQESYGTFPNNGTLSGHTLVAAGCTGLALSQLCSLDFNTRPN